MTQFGNTIVGATTYVQGTTYDAAGRIDKRTSGDGVIMDRDYHPWTSMGGRLEWIKAGTATTPTGLMQLEYAYDAAGNVDWIRDYKLASSGHDFQTLDFTYDAGNRLSGASTANGLGGNYNETYAYDANGNLSKQAGTTVNYAAQSATCPSGALNQPHAATAWGSNSYCYNRNGSQERRTLNGSVYRLSITRSPSRGCAWMAPGSTPPIPRRPCAVSLRRPICRAARKWVWGAKSRRPATRS